MDFSMQLVSQFCHAELLRYSQCVEANPSIWNTVCDTDKMKLAHCAQQNPAIQRIKLHCQKSFSEYEECLQKNPSQVFKCFEPLERFSKCAERYTIEHSDDEAKLKT